MASTGSSMGHPRGLAAVQLGQSTEQHARHTVRTARPAATLARTLSPAHLSPSRPRVRTVHSDSRVSHKQPQRGPRECTGAQQQQQHPCEEMPKKSSPALSRSNVEFITSSISTGGVDIDTSTPAISLQLPRTQHDDTRTHNEAIDTLVSLRGLAGSSQTRPSGHYQHIAQSPRHVYTSIHRQGITQAMEGATSRRPSISFTSLALASPPRTSPYPNPRRLSAPAMQRMLSHSHSHSHSHSTPLVHPLVTGSISALSASPPAGWPGELDHTNTDSGLISSSPHDPRTLTVSSLSDGYPRAGQQHPPFQSRLSQAMMMGSAPMQSYPIIQPDQQPAWGRPGSAAAPFSPSLDLAPSAIGLSSPSSLPAMSQSLPPLYPPRFGPSSSKAASTTPTTTPTSDRNTNTYMEHWQVISKEAARQVTDLSLLVTLDQSTIVTFFPGSYVVTPESEVGQHAWFRVQKCTCETYKAGFERVRRPATIRDHLAKQSCAPAPLSRLADIQLRLMRQSPTKRGLSMSSSAANTNASPTSPSPLLLPSSLPPTTSYAFGHAYPMQGQPVSQPMYQQTSLPSYMPQTAEQYNLGGPARQQYAIDAGSPGSQMPAYQYGQLSAFDLPRSWPVASSVGFASPFFGWSSGSEATPSSSSMGTSNSNLGQEYNQYRPSLFTSLSSSAGLGGNTGGPASIQKSPYTSMLRSSAERGSGELDKSESPAFGVEENLFSFDDV